eukprot:jgi/Phyca11/17485/fgenesh1_pg.PHYCAscaffold_28_\
MANHGLTGPDLVSSDPEVSILDLADPDQGSPDSEGTSTAALLKALRQASTAPATSNAVDQAVERLISTTSLSESQNLVFAASICTEPKSKAEFLGFVLVQETFDRMKTLGVSTVRQLLLKDFNANKSVLSGYLGAISALDGPIFSSSMDCTIARSVLKALSPVFKAVLADNLETEGHKAAVLNVMSSIYWHFDDDATSLRTTAARVLVEALELVSHSQLTQATYVCHVTLVVDMLNSFMDPTKEQVELASRTARFVLESTQILIDRDEGVPVSLKVGSARLFGEWMASCLYSLARLAATTTDTMRIVLRLIDSMNSTTNMRPMALKLMYEVWRNESRGDDEEQMTEEEVEEQLDDLMQRLGNEHDSEVRIEIEKLMTAVVENEMIDVKNVKRKDKLVRLATQNVDELVVTVTTVLQSMELPWASSTADDSCSRGAVAAGSSVLE